MKEIDSMSADTEKVALLIAEVRLALAHGTRHFDVRGKPLNTDVKIIAALIRDGKITFKPKVKHNEHKSGQKKP